MDGRMGRRTLRPALLDRLGGVDIKDWDEIIMLNYAGNACDPRNTGNLIISSVRPIRLKRPMSMFKCQRSILI